MIININGGNGGGGGGSYTLPVASASVLGGVKIGSGITIDASGAISAQGGGVEAFKVNVSALQSEDWTSDDYSALTEMVEYLSGKTEMVEAYIDAVSEGEPIGEGERYTLNYLDSEGAIFFYLENNLSYKLVLNFGDVEQSFTEYTELGGGAGGYNVVSSLPASANNGELFFIPAHSAETQYNVYIFNCSNWSEGEDYVLPSEGLNGKSLYYAPDSNWFHWDWGENENIWKEISGWGWYKVDQENRTFYAAFTEEFTFNDINPKAQLTTGTTAFTETFLDETYRYVVSAFTKEENIFYFGEDNFNRLMSLKENGADLSQLTYVYDGLHGVFENYDSENNKFNFRLADLTYDPVGTPLLEKNRWLGVTEYGAEVENLVRVPLPMTVEIDLSSSGLSSGLWVRTVAGDFTWGGNPIVLRGRNGDKAEIWSQNVWFRPFYDADNNAWESLMPYREDGYNGCQIFGSEFYYKGKKIVAEWFVNGEGTSTLMNWNETALSTADSTPPSA